MNATKVNAKQDTKLLKLSYEELIVTKVGITAVWAKRLKWIWTVILMEGSSSCFSPPLVPPSRDGIALWRQCWRFFSFSFSIFEIESANSFSLQCPETRNNEDYPGIILTWHFYLVWESLSCINIPVILLKEQKKCWRRSSDLKDHKENFRWRETIPMITLTR